MTATTEPSEFTAGDTVTWTKALDDYPAPTWVLTYSFRRGTTRIQTVAAASGTDHAVTIAAADSDEFKPGTWDWQAQVAAGAARHTVGVGTVDVRADLSDEATDHRSFYQRALEAIEEVIEGKAEHDLSQFGIRSRSGTRLSWDELLSARRYFQDKVLEEKGKKPGFIHTRFR